MYSADLGRRVVRRAAAVERRQVGRGDDLSVHLGHPDRPLGRVELAEPLDAVGDRDRRGVRRGPAGRDGLVVDIHDGWQVGLGRVPDGMSTLAPSYRTVPVSLPLTTFRLPRSVRILSRSPGSIRSVPPSVKIQSMTLALLAVVLPSPGPTFSKSPA